MDCVCGESKDDHVFGVCVICPCIKYEWDDRQLGDPDYGDGPDFMCRDIQERLQRLK